MTPGQHYDRADFILKRAEAMTDQLVERMDAGGLGMNETEVSVSVIALHLAAAQVHATLAAVADDA